MLKPPPNMEKTIDLFSHTAYYMDCKFDDIKLASGTCFFVKRSEKFFLITNWHNVTGQNPITGEYLSGKISFPNNLDVQVFKNQEFIDWDILNVKLLDKNGNPLWREHPLFSSKVDVVAIPIDIPSNLLILPIENMIEPHNEETTIEVKNDVFILGFPFGLKGGGGFPIWKRASIASEPIIDIDNLPKMYVDTASRSGMSGSPVLYKEKRTIAFGTADMITSRYYNKVVGIYSGRIGADDEFKAQLGIVWKFSVVDDIIML